MDRPGLTAFGNEFSDARQERDFQVDRLPESRRHGALLLGIFSALNLVYFFADLRLFGTADFFMAASTRVAILAVSFAGALVAARVRTPEALRQVLVVWQVVTVLATLPRLSGQSEADLATVFLLPALFYLLVPASFRIGVVTGLSASAVLLGGYLWGQPGGTTETPELVAGMATLNGLLILHMAWHNRNRRQEWAAVKAMQQANADLDASRALNENMFMAVPVPMVVTRAVDGRILRYNDAAQRFFGGNPAAFGVHHIQQLYMVPEQREEMAREVQRAGHIAGLEASIVVSDGSQREVLVAASAFDLDGEPAVISGTVDITTRKALERHLAFLATSDPLTGLANRHRFFSAAQRELQRASRHGHETAVLVADVDHFKRINDTYGHEAGDTALTRFAEVLQGQLRAEDLLARLGGEEFAALLPETDLVRGAVIAERLRAVTEALAIDAGGVTISITVSIGVAQVRPEDDSIDAALSRGDRAMYRAKKLGRNRVIRDVVHAPDLLPEADVFHPVPPVHPGSD